VDGRLRQRSCETREGDKRTVYEIEAGEIGVSVKFAACKVATAARSAPAQSGGHAQAGPRAAAASGGVSSEPPF